MNKGDVCMANKSANIVVRVEPQVKKKAEAILASLGMSPSSAINALYHQIIYTNGLPFSITLPPNVPVMEDMSEEDFDNMMKDRTSIVIAHRLSTIQRADLIIVLKDGHIIETGNHETLMNQKGFYYSMYSSQFN